jgi:two-component system, chemotaxis family, CheB/CheR fusion protein
MPTKKVPLKRAVAKAAPANLRKDAEQALLRRYVPAALVIDSDLLVVHLHGDTAPFLALPAGPPFFRC